MNQGDIPRLLEYLSRITGLGKQNKTNLEETKKLKWFKLQSEFLFEENKRPEDEKSGQGFFCRKFTGSGGKVTEERLEEAAKLYKNLRGEMNKENLYEVCLSFM